MKKLISLITLITLLTGIAIAQVEEQSGQFFGGERAIEYFNQYDFGKITNTVSHTFEIFNSTPNPMYITELNIPEGVSVTVLKKVVNPGEKAQIVVTIDKNYFKKTGEFSLPLKVKTKQKVGGGIIQIKEYTFLIKGNVE